MIATEGIVLAGRGVCLGDIGLDGLQEWTDPDDFALSSNWFGFRCVQWIVSLDTPYLIQETIAPLLKL